MWWVIWLGTAGSTGRCLYQIDSYRYWQAQLGRDDFTYGSSGRTPPSRVWPTTGCASATATGSGEAAQLPQRGPPVVARVVTGARVCDVLHSLPRWDDTPFGSAYSSVRCLTLGR